MNIASSSELLTGSQRNQDSNLGPKPFRAPSISGKLQLLSLKPPGSNPVPLTKPALPTTSKPVLSLASDAEERTLPPENDTVKNVSAEPEPSLGYKKPTLLPLVNASDIRRQRESMKSTSKPAVGSPDDVRKPDDESAQGPEWLKSVKLKAAPERAHSQKDGGHPSDSQKQEAVQNIAAALGGRVSKPPVVARKPSLSLSASGSVPVTDPQMAVIPRDLKPPDLPGACNKPVSNSSVADATTDELTTKTSTEKDPLRQSSLKNLRSPENATSSFLASANVPPKSPSFNRSAFEPGNMSGGMLPSNPLGSKSDGQRAACPSPTIEADLKKSFSSAAFPVNHLPKVYPLPPYSKQFVVPVGLQDWLLANVLSKPIELLASGGLSGPSEARLLHRETSNPSLGAFFPSIPGRSPSSEEMYDDVLSSSKARQPSLKTVGARLVKASVGSEHDDDVYDDVIAIKSQNADEETYDDVTHHDGEEVYDDVSAGVPSDEVYDDVVSHKADAGDDEVYDDVEGSRLQSAQDEDGEIYEPVVELNKNVEAYKQLQLSQEGGTLDSKAEKERKKREEKLRKDKEKEEKREKKRKEDEKKRREKDLRQFGLKSDEDLMSRRGGLITCKDEFKASKKLDLSYKCGEDLTFIENVACPAGKLLAMTADGKVGYIYKALFGMEESPTQEKKKPASPIPFEEVAIPADGELYEELPDGNYRPPVPSTPRPGVPQNGAGGQELYDDVKGQHEPEELYEPI